MKQPFNKASCAAIAAVMIMAESLSASGCAAQTNAIFNKTVTFDYTLHSVGSDLIRGGTGSDKIFISPNGLIFLYQKSCTNSGSIAKIGETMDSQYQCRNGKGIFGVKIDKFGER